MRDRVVRTNFLRNRPPWFASTCVNLSHLITVGCTALRSQGDHIWSESPVPSQTYQHLILSHRSCPKLQQWYSTLHLPLPTYLFCITSELSKPETWLCLARSPDVLPWKPAIRGTAELQQQLTPSQYQYTDLLQYALKFCMCYKKEDTVTSQYPRLPLLWR